MTKPRISLIAAVADNGVIGVENGLPWKIKSEMQYFKTTTMGCPVITGRKNFTGMKRALPGRKNIVLTRDTHFTAPDVIVAHDPETALTLAAEGDKEIFVIGGEEIYRLMLPFADRLYLTEVHFSPEGDTHFPDFDRRQWVETKRERHTALAGEDADYTITVLERKLP